MPVPINQFLFSNLISIIIVFTISLFLLIKSSDLFTKYAEKLGLAMGIPQFIVGVTIVSMGTSLPEVATSIISVLKGESAIVASNVVGSNIANILLVIGIVAIVARHLKVEWNLMRIDLPLLLGSAILLTFTLYDGLFTFAEAVLSVAAYVIYALYTISLHKKQNQTKKEKFSPVIPVFLVASGIAIALTADYVISSIIAFVNLPEIKSLGFINTAVVGITAVAVGTSLPEVSVSLAAVKQKNYELAVGNVIGSNIFNSFIVMALPAFIAPLEVTKELITIAIPFMVAATLFYIISVQDREVSGYEGAMYLIVYLLFIGKLFHVF